MHEWKIFYYCSCDYELLVSNRGNLHAMNFGQVLPNIYEKQEKTASKGEFHFGAEDVSLFTFDFHF